MPMIKKSIVFCHGIWADGSCFNKVIPALQAEGHEVMAAQYGLDTPEGDVATVKRTLGRVSSPAILVGHSYGGSVITAAGTDDRVAGLVCIAAPAPDSDETSQSQQAKFRATDVFKYIDVTDGRLWLRPEGVACFVGAANERMPRAKTLEAFVSSAGAATKVRAANGFCVREFGSINLARRSGGPCSAGPSRLRRRKSLPRRIRGWRQRLGDPGQWQRCEACPALRRLSAPGR